MKRSSTDKASEFLFHWRVIAPMSAPIPEEEYNFDSHLGRKHRFDFAWLYKKVAVEIEGNAWHVQGGGRHMTDSDLEKYNLAVSLGWRVFRFSPAMLKRDPAKCIEMVVKAIGQERITT